MAAGNHIVGSPGNSPGKKKKYFVKFNYFLFLALKYEMQLVESVYINGTKEITTDRIDLCFSILVIYNTYYIIIMWMILFQSLECIKA